MMGRIQLVNSVIGGIVQYSFRIYKWPLNLVKGMETNIRTFIWTGSRETRVSVTTNWSKIWKHNNEGGQGVINLKTENQVVMMRTCGLIL